MLLPPPEPHHEDSKSEKKACLCVRGKTGCKNLKEFGSSSELLEWFFPFESCHFLVFFLISSLSGPSHNKGTAEEGGTS